MGIIGLSFDGDYPLLTKSYDPSNSLKGKDLIDYYGIVIEYSDPE